MVALVSRTFEAMVSALAATFSDVAPSCWIAVVVLFHVPGILLLWPRIVWRKNWLFGLIPGRRQIEVTASEGVHVPSRLPEPAVEQEAEHIGGSHDGHGEEHEGEGSAHSDEGHASGETH